MQAQLQINQQLQQQKQDLVHCNNSFGMLLSSLESFFIKSGYNITVLFGYYNHFNDISWKSLDEIKSQLYVDLMLYKMQKEAFFKKYKEIYFPDYPPIKDIIQVIEQWKKISNTREEKKICDEVLDLINDKNAKSMSYYYGKIENIKSSSIADPTKSFQMSNKIHDIMDKRDEKISKDLMKNPNTKFGIEIGRAPGSSEFSHLEKNIDIKKNKSPEQLKFEKDIVPKFKSLFKIINEYSTQRHFLDLSKFYHNFIPIETESKSKDLGFIFKEINIDQMIKIIDELISKEQNRDYSSAFKNLREFLISLKNTFNR